MSKIDERFPRKVDTMTVPEKFARMLELNEAAWWKIARRVIKEHGEMPLQVLKWRVALKMYGRNRVCRELIEGQLAKLTSGGAEDARHPG